MNSAHPFYPACGGYPYVIKSLRQGVPTDTIGNNLNFTTFTLRPTICPGSSDPFYMVTYYKKWVTTIEEVPLYNYYFLDRQYKYVLHIRLAYLGYWVTQKLPQIYTANHATFPIRISKITVQIFGNFWVTQ